MSKLYNVKYSINNPICYLNFFDIHITEINQLQFEIEARGRWWH